MWLWCRHHGQWEEKTESESVYRNLSSIPHIRAPEVHIHAIRTVWFTIIPEYVGRHTDRQTGRQKDRLDGHTVGNTREMNSPWICCAGVSLGTHKIPISRLAFVMT